MSTPWYKTAFDATYLERYAHRDEAEARAFVGLLLEHVRIGSSCRVLDLCCGGGRHARVLADSGHGVVGIDLSMDMLKAATLKAHADNPQLLRGDMRHLPFADASFTLITHLFTAFGYFDRDEENLGVFGEVARILVPGGWYVLDFFCDRAVQRTVGTEERPLLLGHRERTVRRVAGNPPRIEKTVLAIDPQGREEVTVHESVRLFSPEELRFALSRVGLRPREEWGGYHGDPFDHASSSRYIALCQFQPSGSD